MIDSNSEHLDTFISAVDLLFNFLKKDLDEAKHVTMNQFKMIVSNDSNFDNIRIHMQYPEISEHMCQLKLFPSVEETLLKIKLLLSLLLKPNKMEQIVKDEEFYREELLILDTLAENAAIRGWKPVMQLIILFDLLDRGPLLNMFESSFSSKISSKEFVQSFYDLLKITKKEFDLHITGEADFLLPFSFEYVTLDKFKYLLELIEQNGLDVKQFIDTDYHAEKPNHYGRLLIDAVYKEHSAKLVQFLVDKGANITLTDKDGHTALWHAQDYFHKGIKLYALGEISEEDFISREKVIKILEEALNKQTMALQN